MPFVVVSFVFRGFDVHRPPRCPFSRIACNAISVTDFLQPFANFSTTRCKSLFQSLQGVVQEPIHMDSSPKGPISIERRKGGKAEGGRVAEQQACGQVRGSGFSARCRHLPTRRRPSLCCRRSIEWESISQGNESLIYDRRPVEPSNPPSVHSCAEVGQRYPHPLAGAGEWR